MNVIQMYINQHYVDLVAFYFDTYVVNLFYKILLAHMKYITNVITALMQ